MISQYFTRRNDAGDIHRDGNHAFRDFSSLRIHFRAAYYMRLLYANMGDVNNISTLAQGLHEQRDLDSPADSPPETHSSFVHHAKSEFDVGRGCVRVKRLPRRSLARRWVEPWAFSSENSTQSSHDSMNIKAKPFSPQTDSRSRVAGPHQMQMKLQ